MMAPDDLANRRDFVELMRNFLETYFKQLLVNSHPDNWTRVTQLIFARHGVN